MGITASELFAIANGGRNEGKDECHWCVQPCPQLWRHDDDPVVPFQRTSTYARRPSSHWVCFGCWRFRWKRVTVPFLGGGFKDGQCAEGHSLWVTEQGVWVVRLKEKEDREALYRQLLQPPLRWCLMLLEGAGQVNRLHLAVANDHVHGVRADTALDFTVNNIRHSYTPYDLEEALRHGADGKSPGVQALVRLLGEYAIPPREGARPEGKMPVGRPKPLEGSATTVKKVVAAKSGEQAA